MFAAFSSDGTSPYHWFNSSSVTGWPTFRISPNRAAIFLETESRSRAYRPMRNRKISPPPIRTHLAVRLGALRCVGGGGGIMSAVILLNVFALALRIQSSLYFV